MSTAARRPFKDERIAEQRPDVEILIDGEDRNALARRLADFTQIDKRTGNGLAGFLGEFAPGSVFSAFWRLELTLGNGPGTEVARLPEWATRMRKHDP